MEGKQIFNLPAEAIKADGTVEIILREGQPNELPVKDEYRKIEKRVTVDSVDTYIQGRKFAALPQDNDAIIIYCLNEKNPTFDFYEDMTNARAHVVKSGLTKNPDLAPFQINADVYFNQEQLVKLLRRMSHCFQDITEVQSLITALQNYEIKFEQTMSNMDDRQGSAEKKSKTTLQMMQGVIKTKWNLWMPLYLGQLAIQIPVELEIERMNDNRPGFAFFSLELEKMLRDTAAAIILEKVGKYKPQFITLEVE